ncbi:MAG: cytochrome c3 family protein [Tepidisphaeraceae bacterium]
MAARFPPQPVCRLLVVAAVCAAALVWGGCSPKEGFNALRDFFDIGPEAAPATRPSVQGVANQSPGNVSRPEGPTIMSHKPFVDGRCRECHEDPSAGNTITIHVESKVCLKCHAKLLNEYPVMHGAVVARACLFCHEAHESAEPSLLRTRDQSLCFQCHAQKQLLTTTAGHRLDKVVCVNCHKGHGGNEIPFLKPSVLNPVVVPKADAGKR